MVAHVSGWPCGSSYYAEVCTAQHVVLHQRWGKLVRQAGIPAAVRFGENSDAFAAFLARARAACSASSRCFLSLSAITCSPLHSPRLHVARLW